MIASAVGRKISVLKREKRSKLIKTAHICDWASMEAIAVQYLFMMWDQSGKSPRGVFNKKIVIKKLKKENNNKKNCQENLKKKKNNNKNHKTKQNRW